MFWKLFEGAEDAVERRFVGAFQITFPNGENVPAETAKCAGVAGIASGIGVEFRLPERGIGLWEWKITFRAVVPIAAMDEDGDAF